MSKPFAALWNLFCERPGRTAALSVAPVVLASAQGINALVHGTHSPLVAVFVIGMLATAIATTRQSLASFRTESLERELFEDIP
ncbi:hypothetical protein [Halogeometricum borinquense]|uniref:hypothetical protein n=1 Tax=Halogeometricum borinquense TaxID=60847 RepID=UPI0034462F2D